MTKVVAYVRVSYVGPARKKQDGRFISPELQQESIKELAKRENLTIVETFKEIGVSGGRSDRPLWLKAIEMVEKGQCQGIAVWNLSRFSRSLKDALDALERIEAAGGRVYSATEDFGQGLNAKLLRNILLSIAENERERATASFLAATINALDRGIWVASKIPYGYRRNAERRLEVVPEEAAVVRGVFERRARGMSWSKLTLWANENGCPLREKSIWHMAHNRTYLGETRYGDEVREGTHEAIVPRLLFKRCQEPGKRSARSGALTSKYLFQGIVVCHGCGHGLYLSNGKPRAANPDGAHYRCRNIHCHDRGYATARDLDAWVLGYIEREVDTVSPSTWITRPGSSAAIDEAQAELDAATAALDEWLSDRKLITTLGAERYNRETEEYVMAVTVVREELEKAREAGEATPELLWRLFWHEWGHAERTEWLDKMIEQVVLRKGREPLSERCEVELR